MFWKNFVALCNAQNTSPTNVLQKIGIAHGCVTKWKTKETKPSSKTIAKLAEYFGVQDFYFAEENTFYTMKPNFYSAVKNACDQAKITLSSLAADLEVSQNFLEWIHIGIMPSELLLWSIGNHLWTRYNVKFDEKEYILHQGIIEKKQPSNIKPNAVVLQDMKVHLVPLYESVSAGFGALANDHVIDYVPCLFVSDSEAEETLCLKVKGDSMYPKIEDGDVIQVHKQNEADSGAIVVALVDPENGEEEGLVKRIQYGENSLELQSINPMYPPLRFKGPDMNRVRVLGVVKKIIKSV